MSDLPAPALQRVLGPVGVTMLTLPVLSPGASVLVAGADILRQAGTGAALAFLLGGVLTLIFTFAQAELGSSFPLAGGCTCMCWRPRCPSPASPSRRSVWRPVLRCSTSAPAPR